ncbi:MAG: type IV pilus assembly protein PilM [Syntrophaceticus schinkii]|jgi:type IV pilus assembly protein PilM|nr:type IV pilus assembly protein PilM [Syntrophaceticus schinkii]
MGFLSTKNAVGLDIDTAEIRAVELSGSVQSPKLVKFGRIPLPGGAVIEGMIANPGMVEDALHRLWSDAGFSTREVILGVSNQGVLVRFAAFPKVNGNRMDKMIRFQAQEHIPFPLDSVVLDYIVVGEGTGEAGDVVEVLLVAGKRDMLNIFIEVVSGASLKVKDIDVSPLVLQQVLPPVDRKGTVAIVNIANELSNILVMENGTPHFARISPTGLQMATEFFSCSLNEVVPVTKASEIVWSEDAVSVWGATLAGDINSSLSYYQTQHKGAAIERIFLSGRGARMDGLAERIQENLGLPVAIIHPLDGIDVANKNTGICSVALDFTVSVALARRGLEV